MEGQAVNPTVDPFVLANIVVENYSINVLKASGCLSNSRSACVSKHNFE